MTIPMIVLCVGLDMLLVDGRAQTHRWPIVRGWWHRFRHELPLLSRSLGDLIQRPGSHCVHHQEGLHDYNGDGQENRLVELLMGSDIRLTTRSGGAL